MTLSRLWRRILEAIHLKKILFFLFEDVVLFQKVEPVAISIYRLGQIVCSWRFEAFSSPMIQDEGRFQPPALPSDDNLALMDTWINCDETSKFLPSKKWLLFFKHYRTRGFFPLSSYFRPFWSRGPLAAMASQVAWKGYSPLLSIRLEMKRKSYTN